MTRPQWIVCERTGAWARALRVAIARDHWLPETMPKIYEVRRPEELTQQLALQPNCLALVEFDRDKFGDRLSWLAETVRSYPQARFVAFLNRSVWDQSNVAPTGPHCGWHAAQDALFEAGASDVLTSPRNLRGLLELGRQIARWQGKTAATLSADVPIAERAWAQLPWQDR